MKYLVLLILFPSSLSAQKWERIVEAGSVSIVDTISVNFEVGNNYVSICEQCDTLSIPTIIKILKKEKIKDAWYFTVEKGVIIKQADTVTYLEPPNAITWKKIHQ